MTLFFLSVISLIAQEFSLEVWHYGEVLLKDSSAVRGKMLYSFSEEEIRLKSPSSLKVLHAKDVLTFRFTDSLTKNLREVKTIKYKTSDDYAIPAFFEVLVNESSCNLLRREYLLEYPITDGVSGFVSSQKVLEVDYFYEVDGEVFYLLLKQKRFFDVFGTKASQMKIYFKDNKLRLRNEVDLIKIFKYYKQII